MKTGRRGVVQFTLVAASATLVLVFLQLHTINAERHSQVVDLLRRMEQTETEMTIEALRIASFRLSHYDGLIELGQRLRQLKQRLSSTTPGEAAPLQRQYRDYLGLSRRRMDLLEHIKSYGAMLRHYQNYLPTAIDALPRSNTGALGLGAMADRVLARILHYNLSPSANNLRRLEEQLDQLEMQGLESEHFPEIETILTQVRLDAELTKQMTRTLADFLALPTNRTLKHLASSIEQEFTQRSANLRRYSLFLLGVSILLFAGLGYTMHRLKEAQARTTLAWTRLRDAIESLSESFALFDRHGRLQLWNSRYGEYYPKIRDLLRPGISFIALTRAALRRGQFAATRGNDREALRRLLAIYRDTKGPTVIELDDGRFLLTTSNPTSTHGTACVGVDISSQKRVETDLRKLSRAVEQSPESIIITTLDGTIEYVNPKFETITGYSAAEVLGKNPRVLKSGETPRGKYATLWATIQRGEEWRGEFHNRRKDGTLYWETASISAIRDHNGCITHYVAVKEDITARKRAEEQLSLAATVFDKIGEGLMVTDAHNRIKAVNQAFHRITGYSEEEVLGKDPGILRSGRQTKHFYAALWESLKTKGHWEGEIWNRRKDGEVYPEWLSLTGIRDSQGGIGEYVAVFSDTTQRKRDEEKIRWQANFDALTELPNRNLFFDRLGTAIAGAERAGQTLAILFVDLDRFKTVNDSLGHAAGDQVLREVAMRLSRLVRGNDSVARLSGDEFVVLVTGLTDGKEASPMAQRVVDSLSRAFLVEGHEVYIGASVGIALYPEDADTGPGLLRNADMAMYRAKQAGRNTYRYFTRSMDRAVADRARLERDLRTALEQNQFQLLYQPIIDPYIELATPIGHDPGGRGGTNTHPDIGFRGHMKGVEVLLRWHHPEHGVLSPDRFIGLAEETGLIGPIGLWVLRAACTRGAQWHRQGMGALSVAVNLSSRQMRGGFDRGVVAEILEQTGFPAASLVLEITESMFLEETEDAIRWLEDLHELGVRLSLDDFGTGYSSLSYLKRFPMDSLKIDRSFIRDIANDPDDALLTEAIIAMAHSLRLKVTGEGVETEQQLRFLTQRGCDYIQGFYYSKPLDAEGIEAYFTA